MIGGVKWIYEENLLPDGKVLNFTTAFSICYFERSEESLMVFSILKGFFTTLCFVQNDESIDYM